MKLILHDNAPNAAQRGFSLIELMVAIAIGGILLSIAVGTWGNMREESRTEGVREKVLSALQLLRLRALSSGSNQTVTFDWTNDTMVYTTDATYTLPFSPVDIQGFKCAGSVLKPAGSDEFTFTPRGSVVFSDPAAQNIRIQQSGNARMFTIKVNDVTGRIAVKNGGGC